MKTIKLNPMELKAIQDEYDNCYRLRNKLIRDNGGITSVNNPKDLPKLDKERIKALKRMNEETLKIWYENEKHIKELEPILKANGPRM